MPYAGKPGQLQDYVKLHRRLWAESGHPRGAEQIQVAQFWYVAEKRDEAMRGFERILVASILAATPDRIIAQGGAFVGTPDLASKVMPRFR